MTLATSLFLIAVGAILRFAVTVSVAGVNVQTIGSILMIVGVLGLVLTIALNTFGGGRDDYYRDRGRYPDREPRDPYR
jgi:hypothetical protein